MNESYGRDINLKWLFYRILRAWRSILFFTLSIALVAGIIGGTLKMVKLNDEAFMKEARLNFERNHAAWVLTGENLSTKLENLEKNRNFQAEYNEDSILMKINPRKKNEASLNLSIKYQSTTSNNQNYEPDNSNISVILGAYETYMAGKMRQDIFDCLEEKIELRYLNEIIKTSVDFDKKILTVSVTHVTAEKCQELLSFAKTKILLQKDSIESIAYHEIPEINEIALFETIDLTLEEAQKKNVQLIADFEKQIQETITELRSWEATEPEFEYTVSDAIKSAIIIAVIVGIALFFILSITVAITAMWSNKLLNPEDMKDTFGLHLFGLLPIEKSKKAFMPAKLSKLCGVNIKAEEYESLATIIATSIKSVADAKDINKSWKRIAFTGMIPKEDMQKAIDAIQIKGYEVICAPKLLTTPSSIEAIASADAVVLMEEQEKTLLPDIEKELEFLQAWNKDILGAVVINADAIM